ncbi:MAG: S4 domain-containing protein [Mariprofundaceae bacterium]|nr:S4 domain-containing protein [Mariprofundaceae bacterium]
MSSKSGIAQPDTPVRIDRWLWAARFYKTRSLAGEAVKGGHVWVNGSRAKPARPVQPGDEVRIQKGEQAFVLSVIALADKRGSASIAQALYTENEESIRQRALLAEQRRLKAASAPAPDKRPDKRQRRRIIRFKEG